MYKQIRKYIVVFTVLLIFLMVTFIGVLFQQGYRQRKTLEKIGISLETGSTISEIAEAIPKQFEIGASRKEVLEKTFEIFPDIDVNSNNHGFWICNSKGCVDYISFYDETVGLELSFRFRYDDSGNLSSIEHAPGS